MENSDDKYQIARQSFFKTLWKMIIDENNTGWIENAIAHGSYYPNAPTAQIGKLLEKMVENDFDKKDIIDFVRAIQYDSLFGVCALLSGCYEETSFRLCTENEETGKMMFLDSLHEDFLRLDPTGREMRPRKD